MVIGRRFRELLPSLSKPAAELLAPQLPKYIGIIRSQGVDRCR